MVHYADSIVELYWPDIFSGFLILSETMAIAVCAANEAQGSVARPVPVTYAEVCTGFSPHEAHAHQAFFGWILPTIRTSEFTILQIVGLDAAVVRAPPPWTLFDLTSDSF